MLFILPIELVWVIFHEFLQTTNRKILRLVCKRLNELLRPSVLSHVVIDVHEGNLDISLFEELSGEPLAAITTTTTTDNVSDQAEPSQMEDGDLPVKTYLGTDVPLPNTGTRIPASEFIRGVTVKSLNPRLWEKKRLNAFELKTTTRADGDRLAVCEQRLAVVIGGLRTLKNLDYLRLCPRDTIGSLAVAEWLLPQCTSFSRLDLSMYGPGPVLDYLILNPTSLRVLKSLSISSSVPHCPPPGSNFDNCQKVSKIISLSPQLRDLTVKRTTDHGLISLLTRMDSPFTTLEIFPFTTLSITLGNVRLSNAFTPIILNALTPNLTSLELMLDDTVRSSRSDIMIWEYLECFWNFMQPEYLVNLHTLRTNYLSLVMLERLTLTNYVPRLRVLSILSPPLHISKSCDMKRTAKMFFRDVVPALAARKLERLDVQVTSSLDWCFEQNSMAEFQMMIQKLDRLVHLGISIISCHVLDSDNRGDMAMLLDSIRDHATLRDLVIDDHRCPLLKPRRKCNKCTPGYLEGILRYRRKGKYGDIPVISTTSGVVFRPCVFGKVVKYTYSGPKKGAKECRHGADIEMIL